MVMTQSEAAQIIQVHYEYIRAIDDGEPETLANLFVPDGEFILGDRSFTGHDEIRGFLEAGLEDRPPAYQHLSTNPLVEVDDDTAAARWSYILLKADDPNGGPGEWAIGTHDVSYERTDAGWKMTRLEAARTYTGEL